MSIRDALLETRYDEVRDSTYLALDVASEREALQLVNDFTPVVDGYKIGLELFHRAGKRFVETLLERDLRVFLDMKLHDIPNTVYGALKSICELPIEMVNVHALGGQAMLERAREAVDSSRSRPLLIAVTVLTSLSDTDLVNFGIHSGTAATVERLARVAVDAQMDGVVCSAQELEMLSGFVPTQFERVVPGTRLTSDSRHDQSRVMTPGQAMRRGATRLVLGRAVVQAAHPFQQLKAYWDDMVKEGD